MNLNAHKIYSPSEYFIATFKKCSVNADILTEFNVSRSVRHHSWSFDDGHLDLISIADKYFNPLEIKFRFFVCPDLIDRTEKGDKDYVCCKLKDRNARLMSWNDVKYLVSCGHFIGSHGLDHTPFDDMSYSEMLRQLIESKNRINEKTHIIPDSFAIPFGRLNEKNEIILQDLVFENYKLLYLSDNRLKLSHNYKIVNRRHVEFGAGFFRGLGVGMLNLIGLTR